jgi:UDP-N-acetylglucosamine 2-epimerase (non-hydrolysing)
VRRLKPRAPKKILTLFGTRPEAIKLAPVIQQLEAHGQHFRTINVASSQHTDLLAPFVRLFQINVAHDLHAMSPGQTSNQLCARLLSSLDAILDTEQPDLILVQGDTSTAMAGALAGFHRGIAVGHVEAGLRSGNMQSPFPEEMNRRLISRLATYHFAPTHQNRDLLLAEGVDAECIFVTGNPIVDALHMILSSAHTPPVVSSLQEATEGLKRIILTTHRRESFGRMMEENLYALRHFVETHADVALIFPVHPNPRVVEAAHEILSGHPRIHLIEPLNYDEFIMLLSTAWLIVSDSGGVQEEAPTLGKPLLILRENTERPEVLQSGVARLVGGDAWRLAELLEEMFAAESWTDEVRTVENPFGQGDSGTRIAGIVGTLLGLDVAQPVA